jgi:hypothetical protein
VGQWTAALTTKSRTVHRKYLIVGFAGATHHVGFMDPVAFTRTWKTLLTEKVINHPPQNAYNQTYWAAAVQAM